LSADEGSDIYGGAYLVISANYLERKDGKSITRLFPALPMKKSSIGGIIYTMIKNQVFKIKMIENNLWGL